MADPNPFDAYIARQRAAAPGPAPAASPVAAAAAGLTRGSVYRMTGPEADAARAIGLPEGVPLPAGLPAVVDAARAATGQPDDAAPAAVLAALPEADRAAIRAAAVAIHDDGPDPDPDRLAPGVAEALAVAAAGPDADPAPPVAADDRVGANPPAPGAGAAPPPSHCPNCNWDLADPGVATPTRADKDLYRAVLLGGPEARFRKEYPLFGGAAVVRFRELATADTEAVFARMGEDHRADPFPSDGAYFRRLTEYRLALGLERVARADGTAIAVPARRDALPALRAWIIAEALPRAAEFRAVVAAFDRFERLVRALEDRAADPDF